MKPMLRSFLLLFALVKDTDSYVSSIISQRRIRNAWSTFHRETGPGQRWQQLSSQLRVSRVKEAPLSTTLEEDGARRKDRSPSTIKASQLKKVVHGLEQLGIQTDENDGDWRSMSPPSEELVQIMKDLAYAKTQSQISRIGTKLQEEWVEGGRLFDEDVGVLDRVIRATALAGLLNIAIDICEQTVEIKGRVPSSLAYSAVSVGLRRAKRLRDLEEFTESIGKVSCDIKAAPPLDFRALNMLLATFSDQIKVITTPKKRWNSRGNTSIARSLDELLQAMMDWLLVKAPKDMNCPLESDNFATVMNSFASVGQADVVEDLWRIMTKDYGLSPTIHCYNARLKSFRNDDEKSIEVFRELIHDNQCEMDQYTMDFMLLPYLRNQPDELKPLLRDYLLLGQSPGRRVGSDVFGSFLNTLCRAGEVYVAHDLFDTFVLSGRDGVSATARHYNTLIAAYRKLEERNNGDPDSEGLARQEALGLYDQMVHPDSTVTPDKYTITNMLGMAQKGVDVADLLFSAHVSSSSGSSSDRGTTTSASRVFEPAVLRAAITAFGRVGDIASAVWILDAALRTGADVRHAREYNTLFAAIVHRYQKPSGAQLEDGEEDYFRSHPTRGDERLNIKFCTAAQCLLDLTTKTTTSLDNAKSISMFLHNKSPANASLALLDEMSVRGPRPNEQSFCLVAAAIQDDDTTTPDAAIQLYDRAMAHGGFPGDGRLINSVIRCYGEDIMAALRIWKSKLRRNCLTSKQVQQDLTASYHGLLYVSGRARRPDLALRLVYAMNKEGLDVDEMAFNCYKSGKRKKGGRKQRMRFGMSQYETLLEVECTKYDPNDPRRKDNTRIRIYY